MELFAIPLGALLVSLATLVFTAMSLRQKADTGYVQSVESRVKVAEDKLTKCEDARDALQRENVELTRRLSHVEMKVNGGT